MPNCCYADEYADLFRDAEARRTTRRFLRRGLRGSARRLADGVAATDLDGSTILEVGGGAGTIQADLLRRGAARSVNIELSPNWEPSAAQLAAELALGERVQRRVGDFIDLSDEVRSADIVILHRVICCYPDWRTMLTAAVAKASNTVAVTVPVDRWWTRFGIRMGNRILAWRRRSFRAFVHPPDLMLDALGGAGLTPRLDHSGVIWRTIVAQR